MESTTPRIRSLLRQADRVAESGKRSAAEKLYRQIIDEAPDTAAGWAGLGQVVHSKDEKQTAYRRALDLDPDNVKAKAGLDELMGIVAPVAQDEAETNPAETRDNGSGETGKIAPVQGTPAARDEIEGSGKEKSTESIQQVDTHDHDVVESTKIGTVLYCANHPNRETHLRCNRCGKPICSSCAKPTPVGYRCPECIREHEDIFFNATALDYILAVLVSLPLSLIAGWIAGFLGLFSIFLGAAAGSLIGRIAFRASGRRRGRWMPQLIGAIVVIGGIIPAIPVLLYIFSGHFSLQIIWTGIYIVAASGAAYYQMR